MRVKSNRKRCCCNLLSFLRQAWNSLIPLFSCSGKKKAEQKGLGQVSRIVLLHPLCVLLCMELHAVLQQFTLWQKAFRSPVLSKCLTFDKCCIVLARQQHKPVTFWCLSSLHTLFLCHALVKLESNQGTSGTPLKDRHWIQPTLLRVRSISGVRF